MNIKLLQTLRNYNKDNFIKDIIAGIIIMAVSIPISMGYAQIAGLPAVYGLYGSVFPILVFGLFESFMGAPELCIIFLPMILPLVLDLGFDTMTALAIVICGNCVGYSTGMGNPFTTIIGQKICQLPLYSAMWYRAICFFLFLRDHCMVYF